ncbi:MAG: PIN domain-containing protein, partial [Victivallales bacterium]|nr:PIN domain-containing protein [Victivallales bacterium]
MKTTVLLDSNIVIDHLNGIANATDYLESLPVLRVSSTTVFEVLAGCTGRRAAQSETAKEFFNICDIIEFSGVDAEHAAERYAMAPSKKKILDYFIAGTASTHGFSVATRNPRDFQSVDAFEPYGV